MTALSRRFKAERIPSFDADPLAFRDGNAIHAADMPIEVEPSSTNHIKLTVGGVSRIVDGVSLINAINFALTVARR